MKKKYYWIIGIVILILVFVCNFILFRKSPPTYPNDWKIGVCPSIKQIDCMPIVKPEFETYCRPENREWIQENCPDIKFFD